MKVFLDLDGVLCNWVGGIHRRLGIDYKYDQWPYRKGRRGWSFHSEIGYSIQQISDLCDTNLWVELEWMHDGHEILRVVLEIARPEDIYLLTSPMRHPESATGKTLWVRKNLPEYSKRLIITTAPKAIFARVPDSILIDDSSRNVDTWIEAGGRAILVPRPWNNLWGYADSSVKILWRSLFGVKWGE